MGGRAVTAASRRRQAAVDVDYHFFMVGFQGMWNKRPWPDRRDRTGFISMNQTQILVWTGIKCGLLEVRTEFLDETPAQNDASDQWEEIVEVSLRSPGQPLNVCPPGDASPPEMLGVADLPADDYYRIRFHSAGRDLEPDGYTPEPVERCYLQIWRESEGRDAIVSNGEAR